MIDNKPPKPVKNPCIKDCPGRGVDCPCPAYKEFWQFNRELGKLRQKDAMFSDFRTHSVSRMTHSKIKDKAKK